MDIDKVNIYDYKEIEEFMRQVVNLVACREKFIEEPNAINKTNYEEAIRRIGLAKSKLRTKIHNISFGGNKKWLNTQQLRYNK